MLNVISLFEYDFNWSFIRRFLLILFSLCGANPVALHAAGQSFLPINVHVGILTSGCDINNNEKITIEFNRIGISRVNGVNYKKPIIWSLNCENTPAQLNLKFTGTESSFNKKALETSKTNLGIMLYNENEELPLDTLLSFTYPNLPKLFAVPIKNNDAVLDSGDFNASASLVIIYQ